MKLPTIYYVKDCYFCEIQASFAKMTKQAQKDVFGKFFPDQDPAMAISFHMAMALHRNKPEFKPDLILAFDQPEADLRSNDIISADNWFMDYQEAKQKYTHLQTKLMRNELDNMIKYLKELTSELKKDVPDPNYLDMQTPPTFSTLLQIRERKFSWLESLSKVCPKEFEVDTSLETQLLAKVMKIAKKNINT